MTARRLLLAAALVIAVAVVGGVWIWVKAQQAADALADARTGVSHLRASLADGDPAKAQTQLAVVQGDTARAARATSGPVFAIASALPVVGNTPAAVRDVSRAADALATGPLPDLVAAGTTLSPDVLRNDTGDINLAPFEDAAPLLASATSDLEQISADVAGIDTAQTPAKVSDAVASVQTEVDDALHQTQSASRGAALIPPMLGLDGERSYFFAMQSNNEARGTGGFFGSFGVLTADNGDVAVRQLAPRSKLDDQVYGSMPLDFGADYTALYGDDAASWAGANISPHYPYAAKLWLTMWQDRTGERLDGVITTDPVALSYLLDATGPITLPDGRVIDADNVVSFTENEIYFLIPDDDAARDAYLQLIAKEALDAVVKGGADPRALIDALGRAASERRLLIYSDHRAEQVQLEASSVGGALPGDAAPFTGLATINGGGNKLDYYLDQSLQYDLTGCTPDGGRRATVTATYTNNATGDGSLPIYIDARSDLPLLPNGLPQSRNGESFFWSQVYATAGASLISATQDGAPIEVEQGRELGHTVFRAGVTLPAGASTTLVYEVAEPPAEGQLSTFITPLVKAPQVDADTQGCGSD